MAKNKFYAYFLENSNESGIVLKWDDCKNIIAGQRARYKGFKTETEARLWLSSGANYVKKIKPILKPGIYFDAGTGRGIGVEVKITTKDKVDLLHKILSSDKINQFGNLCLGKNYTNNYGELMGCYYALQIALNENVKIIFGDSKLVLDYWSKGHIKKTVETETQELAHKVAKLRYQFESNGGKIEHVSGDFNPADLGFHKVITLKCIFLVLYRLNK